MKYIALLLITGVVMCSFILSRDNRPEDVKVAHSLMNRVSKLLQKRYRMYMYGFRERGDEQGYSFMGLKFQVNRIVSKEEGRKMVIDSANEFLYAINNTPEMQPYLLEKPFTMNNIEIDIMPMGVDRKGVYHPDIQAFSIRNGIITYRTHSKENKYGFDTVIDESLDEAIKIIEANN